MSHPTSSAIFAFPDFFFYLTKASYILSAFYLQHFFMLSNCFVVSRGKPQESMPKEGKKNNYCCQSRQQPTWWSLCYLIFQIPWGLHMLALGCCVGAAFWWSPGRKDQRLRRPECRQFPTYNHTFLYDYKFQSHVTHDCLMLSYNIGKNKYFQYH